MRAPSLSSLTKVLQLREKEWEKHVDGGSYLVPSLGSWMACQEKLAAIGLDEKRG
jgi:hypothetical protein